MESLGEVRSQAFSPSVDGLIRLWRKSLRYLKNDTNICKDIYDSLHYHMNQKPMISVSAQGFTLLELLVATALSLLVMAMVMTVFVGTLGMWRDGMARLQLSQQSRLVREKMLRGIDGQYGLRQASRTSVGAIINGIAFQDAGSTNIFAVLAPTNQAVQLWDMTRGRQLVGSPGVVVRQFRFDQPATRTLVIDLVLSASSGGKTYAQSQRISVDMLNE